MNNGELVTRAEKAISEVLKNLELETGEVVRSVSIVDVEVTQLDDDRQIFARRVVIDMHRVPGSRW